MTSPDRSPELPAGDLPGVLDGSVPPGVYRAAPVDPAEARALLADAAGTGRRNLLVDLSGVGGRAGFLERCGEALDLPEWSGRNWDALADCLTDLSWWGEWRSCLLVLPRWDDFAGAAPADAATAAEVLSAAVGYWSGRSNPMTVLLC